MVWYKSCPKCGRGDLMLERDTYGWFRQCVQCGYLEDLRVAEKSASVPQLVAERQQAA